MCNSGIKKIRTAVRICRTAAVLAAAMVTMLSGCYAPPAQVDVTPNVIAGPTALPKTDALPTAVITATPEALPANENTSADTPQPTPENTPVETPEDLSRVTVAEGFFYEELSDRVKERITGMSYPDEDSEISYDDLRYITVRCVDFSGEEYTGELVANKIVALELTEIFLELYEAHYPIAKMVLVDNYGEPGDDTLSMADNNTSCFNYRRVTGSRTLSRHSYGMAIDINPMMNPYIDGDRVAPENAAEYVDRAEKLPGMIDRDDLCYKLFTGRGWSWGGEWDEPDYQHFSKPL